MFKKVGKVAAFCVAFLAAGAIWSTRDIDARHPVLKAADLPPLIPTRTFYADPTFEWDFVVSGDAQYATVQKSSLLGRKLVVQNLNTGEEIAELRPGISFLRWHPSKPLIRFIYQGHDWEVDPLMPQRANWKRISPVKLPSGWVKNQIATDPDMPILTWGKTSTRAPAHMWLVSQDGQTAQKVAEGTQETVYWVFDEDTAPVLRFDTLDPATGQLLRKTAEGWKPLVEISVNDLFQPLESVAADGTMLARSSRGRDKAAVVRFDTHTGDETVLHMVAETDIGMVTSLAPDGKADVLRLRQDTQERIALSDRGQIFLNQLAKLPQPVTLGQTLHSASGRYVTQLVSGPGLAPQTLLIDLVQGTSKVISDGGGLSKYKEHLVPEEAVRFSARDGLEIPGVMTRPRGVKGPIPFVIHVHGGPALHVSMGQNPFTQLLVNRGYGVLSVNFRGSTGFGKDFQAKGFREFGRAMQDDIADAALWLVEKGIADTDALIVMGESYGGYAAAMAMTRDPGLFDAAIVEFPMLDVEFQSKHYPYTWKNELESWWRYFGRIEHSEDLEMMRKYSPTNRVEQLHGPVLVLAGAQDQITAVQQVHDFEEKVRATDKDVRFHYFENTGHGAVHWRDRLRRARLIEEFLAKHAGGRTGGFEFAERAPAFID
ncbi:Peptidase S9 prolyl oligopeptidase active site domain protein [Sulfitobacter noctilucicola]|uniref:Dipeptidyl aminopeptidase/acylaminoacyl peptidase n=1 Tax=Sulfitobacter noctilucicola TaxID=1342301 RepID=A0A7W6M8Y2_9RHOB|nr:alpha/beta fold hydrolase [Sulfitobacter noctilucicola]KIN64572.1 Peptidase S9 prolyl oligopeptidase active site domain protein [Sulfitobacter noctilucicola]MBB4174273.1 dipeptidyl aminopeptidase/acylaminoacyl peptidase [Sulfitobacter noctilucicola]